MKFNDFINILNELAPCELAFEYDNVGLLIGTNKTEIKKVLVALDLTVETAKEAIEYGADLVLTHHPIFFSPTKYIHPDDPETAAAYMLIQAGIAHFAMHTNLDKASGGVNDALAEILGLSDVSPLPPEALGRVGSLEKPLTLGEFANFVQLTLKTTVRFSGDKESLVKKVAVIGGSGSGDFYSAHEAGADVFVTGEIKHNHALSAKYIGLNLIEAGHYETEKVVLEPLIKHLQTRTNDVQYRLTLSEGSILKGV